MSTRGGGGGGSYLGSSYDVAKFMRAFQNDQLVSPTIMQDIRVSTNGTPTTIPGTYIGTLNQTYGYGTNIVYYVDSQNDTVSFYGHGGNGLGNSWVFQNIENDFTLALTNNDLSSTAQQTNFALFMDLVCYV